MNHVKLLLIKLFKSGRMRRLVKWRVQGRGEVHAAFWWMNLKERDNTKTYA